jgi:hypothetical protein
MALFIKIILILEYILVEIPATTLSLVVANVTYTERLGSVVEDYVSISSVLLSVVLMIVSGLYLYLAFSKHIHAIQRRVKSNSNLHIGLFGPNATTEVKRILISLVGGTAYIFALYSVNIAIWFASES